MGQLSDAKMEREERLQRKYSDMQKHYNQLKSHKEHGKRKYTEEVVIAKVAWKFYLSDRTVEDIIYNLRSKKQD